MGFAILLGACPAGAEEERRVDLHGFGSWAYGNTDVNAYLSGLPEGKYSNASFSLNVSAHLSEKLRIVGQLRAHDPIEPDSSIGDSVELDYAFAEWKFSDRIALRAGKVKLPFGISGEVFHVGTLRPFLDLPQAVYGPSGLTDEAYEGVGLTGSVPLQSWRLSYDVYGGGIQVDEFLAPEAFLTGRPLLRVEHEKTRDVIGGHIVVETPVDGLRFGASAHTGKEIGAQRRTVAGAQGEYLTDRWSARTEYVHETVQEDLKIDGFYAEAAYRIGPHWQVASQYGRLTSELFGVVVAPGEPLLAHEEIALGLNYWLSPELVFKLDYHHVDGNRFAAPEDLAELAEQAASGGLRKTNLVQLGVQFSF